MGLDDFKACDICDEIYYCGDCVEVNIKREKKKKEISILICKYCFDIEKHKFFKATCVCDECKPIEINEQTTIYDFDFCDKNLFLNEEQILKFRKVVFKTF